MSPKQNKWKGHDSGRYINGNDRVTDIPRFSPPYASIDRAPLRRADRSALVNTNYDAAVVVSPHFSDNEIHELNMTSTTRIVWASVPPNFLSSCEEDYLLMYLSCARFAFNFAIFDVFFFPERIWHIKLTLTDATVSSETRANRYLAGLITEKPISKFRFAIAFFSGRCCSAYLPSSHEGKLRGI